ncbi:hypothetical protein A9P82_14525 [Arachidicoccus ginsenosidimutans]|uniref:FecR family protein n=1 Tax=Arachidicoccus sp. BS20 TaxID=1850526 RepID=UPI0007F166B3|nr:FecR family protein [Arachidicoccus sp. BS20]ANI90395.1 hypothetical protein A9P82_14525 [Arachidicoccus sp. BS20]
MEKDVFFRLLDRYLSGNSSEQEDRLLAEYYRRLDESARQTLGKEKESALKQLMLQNIERRINRRLQHKRIRLWYTIAASIVLLLAIVGFLYMQQKNQATNALVQNNVILPGGNKATLTLADGSQVTLTDAGKGTLAKQGGMEVEKTADGKIEYKVRDAKNTLAVDAVNRITTPRGGQYQLVLSDGTKVWLNAASSISYPIVFTGRTREVTITGEVYFEVAHRPKQPFRVHAGNQTIEDIGTSFDVNAYADEPDRRVTLLEGAVKVGSVLLHPGEQSVEKDGNLSVTNVDARKVIAWKDGYFLFHNASLATIMRQLARWYDVDVEYEGKIPDVHFGGGIARSSNIDEALSILEKSGIHFKIQNKKIIVMP